MAAVASASDAAWQSAHRPAARSSAARKVPEGWAFDDDGSASPRVSLASMAELRSAKIPRRSAWVCRQLSEEHRDLPPERQRWEQVLGQIRLQTKDDKFCVWDVMGDGAQAAAQRPAVALRFASLPDRLLLVVMRCIALLDALWAPVLLSYGRLEWPSGPFVQGGAAQPFGSSRMAKHVCLFETLFFLLYCLGIGMRFNTSSISLRMGKEFMSLHSVASLLLATPSFWADLVSLVGSLWWAVGLRWLAIMRLLRLWRVPSSSYRSYDIALGRARGGFAAACAELLCGVWLAAHFFGCLWFYVVSYPFDTWEELNDAHPDAMPEDLVHAYVQCWGEGIALLVGWNSPTPTSNGRFTMWETLYCIVVGPSASMFLAFVFARLLKALDQAEESESRFNDTMSRVESMLASLETPPNLRKRVLQYYTYMGVHNLDKSTYEMLFQGLSWNLHVELKLFLFQQLILNAPFFQELPPLMVMDMVRSFDLLVFSPGDMVVKKGQVGSEMYFVVKGIVDIMVDDDANVKIAEKTVGDYFGEVALVLDEARTAWAITNSYCVLAQLTKEAFREFTRHAPEVREAMLERISQMRKAQQAQPVRSSLGTASASSCFSAQQTRSGSPRRRLSKSPRSPTREPGPPSHREDMPLLR